MSRVHNGFVIAYATHFQTVNETIQERAQQLTKLNLQPMDAFHLARAEASRCDYFLTCDDRLMKRYKGPLQVKNPVELIF